MKICKIVSFLLIVLIGLCGCSLLEEKGRFQTRLDEICAIQIVELGEATTSSDLFSETPLSDPLDVEVLKAELLALDWRNFLGDPIELYNGDIVFKIEYKNGDFDLVGWKAQRKFKSVSGRYDHGFMVFDETEFMQLIQKYISAN